MSAEWVVLHGLVRPDGTLEVSGKVGLTPGPVEVTVRPAVPATSPASDWWDALQDVRAERSSRGHVPRGAEEIDAEINATRDEWEEHQLGLEAMQETFRRPPDGPPSSAEEPA